MFGEWRLNVRKSLFRFWKVEIMTSFLHLFIPTPSLPFPYPESSELRRGQPFSRGEQKDLCSVLFHRHIPTYLQVSQSRRHLNFCTPHLFSLWSAAEEITKQVTSLAFCLQPNTFPLLFCSGTLLNNRQLPIDNFTCVLVRKRLRK